MFPLTKRQRIAINDTKREIPKMVKRLIEMKDQLNDAVVSLPHENEIGERIKHGSNMACRNRADQLSHAISILQQFCE